jgi:hypothetical protein
MLVTNLQKMKILSTIPMPSSKAWVHYHQTHILKKIEHLFLYNIGAMWPSHVFTNFEVMWALTTH